MAWRKENGDRSANWAYWLKFVQFQINSNYQFGIEQSPCEVVFGKTASVGLASTSLPPDVLTVDVILSENDMQLLHDEDCPPGAGVQ